MCREIKFCPMRHSKFFKQFQGTDLKKKTKKHLFLSSMSGCFATESHNILGKILFIDCYFHPVIIKQKFKDKFIYANCTDNFIEAI